MICSHRHLVMKAWTRVTATRQRTFTRHFWRLCKVMLFRLSLKTWWRTCKVSCCSPTCSNPAALNGKWTASSRSATKSCSSPATSHCLDRSWMETRLLHVSKPRKPSSSMPSRTTRSSTRFSLRSSQASPSTYSRVATVHERTSPKPCCTSTSASASRYPTSYCCECSSTTHYLPSTSWAKPGLMSLSCGLHKPTPYLQLSGLSFTWSGNISAWAY